MKTCSIIGHREIKISNELKENIKETIIWLICEVGVEKFLFGSKSKFADLCYEIVSSIKQTNEKVKRVYVRAEYPYINREYEEYLLSCYEESFYYDKKLMSSKFNYIKRDEIMINQSDLCLFYYDPNYIPMRKTKSGTALAYQYAIKKEKQIINTFKN